MLNTLLLTLSWSYLAVSAVAQAPMYRINMGGPNTITGDWQGTADQLIPGFSFDPSSNPKVSEHLEPILKLPSGVRFSEQLFETEVFARRKPLTLHFQVPLDTTYRLVLYFMESFYASDVTPAREMSITVNDKDYGTVRPRVRGRGFRKSSSLTVTLETGTNPLVTVTLASVVKEPQINAIELSPVSGKSKLVLAQSMGLAGSSVATASGTGPAVDSAAKAARKLTLPATTAKDGSLIWFNNATYTCAAANPFSCIGDDELATPDAYLPAIRTGAVTTNLPWLYFCE